MARKKAKKKHDNGDDEYIPKSNIRKRKVYTRPSESEPPSPNLDVSGTSGGVHEEEEQGQESPGKSLREGTKSILLILETQGRPKCHEHLRSSSQLALLHPSNLETLRLQ
jgi:hypothetical protein